MNVRMHPEMVFAHYHRHRRLHRRHPRLSQSLAECAEALIPIPQHIILGSSRKGTEGPHVCSSPYAHVCESGKAKTKNMLVSGWQLSNL